jgi:MoxR-like ATPase
MDQCVLSESVAKKILEVVAEVEISDCGTVSDRTLVKATNVVRAAAVLAGRSSVRFSDLIALKHVLHRGYNLKEVAEVELANSLRMTLAATRADMDAQLVRAKGGYRLDIQQISAIRKTASNTFLDIESVSDEFPTETADILELAKEDMNAINTAFALIAQISI